MCHKIETRHPIWRIDYDSEKKDGQLKVFLALHSLFRD